MPNTDSIVITDEDIAWAEEIVGLQAGAFAGDRSDVLKNMTTADIQACPGSGKTTLLVAKLAILSKKWTSATKGICVLSHTNVAREEIERRLGGTDVGQKLLRYPHFIGTIHSFINTFVASPWIRSLGYPIETVENDLVLKYRWNKLSIPTRRSRPLARLQENALKATSVEGTPPPIRSGKGFLGPHTATYKALENSIQTSFKEGRFTYDDLILFAHHAVEKQNNLDSILQNRFPILIIDEAQDCNEEQNQILSKTFPDNQNTICQRFGDGNQAIFGFAGEKRPTTNPFPKTDFSSISNSYRFTNSIAALADPLGLIPYNMSGQIDDLDCQHTIFTYSDETISKVIPCYGEHILNSFTEDQLASNKCYAVGQVHNPSDPKPSEAYVKNYWNEYCPNAAKENQHFSSLCEYFSCARKLFSKTQNTTKALNLLSKGISIKLGLPCKGQNKYRYLLNDFEDKSGLNKKRFLIFLINALSNKNFDENYWNNFILETLQTILAPIYGIRFSQDNDYLKWNPTEHQQEEGSPQKTNIFTHQNDHRSVEINLGSIHAVKGQTHLATLVLDTYWYDKNFQKIIDWLTGEKKGKGREGIQNKTRLKCHYVAMTRPSHLLCLAMHEDILDDEKKSILESKSWAIKKVE